MNHFSKQAAAYAKYRPNYPDALFKTIYKYLLKFDKAWDCGTGNGQIASRLAGTFNKVYATDISRDQLKRAIFKPNIEYIENPAENPLFENNMFDLITVAQAIHWFDFQLFYKEVNRTANRNCLLALIGYGRLQTESAANKIISDFYDKMFNSHFSENWKYVEDEYRTIPFPFEEIGYFQYSFQYDWMLSHLQGYMHSWSSVQKFRDSEGTDPTTELILELSKNWNDPKPVEFPIFMRLGRVT